MTNRARNPFTPNPEQSDQLRSALEELARRYTDPVNALGDAFNGALRAIVNQDIGELETAVRSLALSVEAHGLTSRVQTWQACETWAARRVDPSAFPVRFPVNSCDDPIELADRSAEAGYALCQLLDGSKWSDPSAVREHAAVVSSNSTAFGELRDIGNRLIHELRTRLLPGSVTEFEGLTRDNPVWVRLHPGADFSNALRFALGDWQEWIRTRDAIRDLSRPVEASLALSSFALQPAPPEPPAGTPTAVPPTPPNPSVAGFPSHSSYMPPGDLNSASEVWPLASRQLDEFLRCLEAADSKLHSFAGAMLPPALPLWWVRAWADGFLGSTRSVTRVDDIRATYQFARRLDRLLRVTDAPADEPHPFDAEFTYYDRPLTRNNDEGVPGPAPLAHFGHDFERDHGYTPIRFPRSPVPPQSLDPRLRSAEFLAWGGFLASPEPLTEGQRAELGRVGCSDHGVGEWCRLFATHGFQCGRVAESALDRLRWGVQHVADSMRIPPRVVPRDVPFSDALTAVAEWLENAERVSSSRSGQSGTAAAPNAMATEQVKQPVPPPKPNWDAGERVLTFGTWRFEYGKSAPSQEKILAAFQAAGWPSAVQKSLPDNLSSILRNMKKKLGDGSPIAFDADGANGVRWKAK